MQSTMGKEKGKGKRTGRVEIRRIEDPIRRQITFSKRKAGLLKKAAELSLLCDADLALIISSPSGKLYHSEHPNIDKTLGRYQKLCATPDYSAQASQSIEVVDIELENTTKLKMDLERTQNRHIIGEDLSSLSYKELHRLEQKLEISAHKIRSRKEKLFEEYSLWLRKELAGEQDGGKEGPINVTVDVLADYQQAERHDGDLQHVTKSHRDLELSLY